MLAAMPKLFAATFLIASMASGIQAQSAAQDNKAASTGQLSVEIAKVFIGERYVRFLGQRQAKLSVEKECTTVAPVMKLEQDHPGVCTAISDAVVAEQGKIIDENVPVLVQGVSEAAQKHFTHQEMFAVLEFYKVSELEKLREEFIPKTSNSELEKLARSTLENPAFNAPKFEDKIVDIAQAAGAPKLDQMSPKRRDAILGFFESPLGEKHLMFRKDAVGFMAANSQNIAPLIGQRIIAAAQTAVSTFLAAKAQSLKITPK